jgi:CRP/FNR family transcriptional regulator, cyclic AMP receptor protein
VAYSSPTRAGVAHVSLLVGGVVGVFLASAAGRQVTVRYCRPGALMGTASLFTAPLASARRR